MTAIHVHVGHHMTGHLPESEPDCTDSPAAALDVLRSDLRALQGDYFERCEAETPEQQDKGSDCCHWCDVAYDVEAALSAIADGDACAWLARDGAVTWIFYPPEGASVAYRAETAPNEREPCALDLDQHDQACAL